ncbi:MAG: 2-dehydro-3-deoxygalactonokinase [Acetobacteraceae bacterium]
MIGIDWGTTRFRAYLLDATGGIRERRERERGILEVAEGRFAYVLNEEAGDWIAQGERRILLSGMVGSRQGWRETAYLPCPAGPRELARALAPVDFASALVRIVPGVSARDGEGVPEVMRGEETEIAGCVDLLPERAPELSLVCLPGTHSKWARVEGGRIAAFRTHLTGEAYAALKRHTILGRMMEGDLHLAEAFGRGVRRSGEPGGLLHHLFGVRALGLAGELAEREAASYLSGMLIGHEVRAAMAGSADVYLVGAADLCANYAEAIRAIGGQPIQLGPERAAAGLFRIAAMADWGAEAG